MHDSFEFPQSDSCDSKVTNCNHNFSYKKIMVFDPTSEITIDLSTPRSSIYLSVSPIDGGSLGKREVNEKYSS